jgi:hypothetical protein
MTTKSEYKKVVYVVSYEFPEEKTKTRVFTKKKDAIKHQYSIVSKIIQKLGSFNHEEKDVLKKMNMTRQFEKYFSDVDGNILKHTLEKNDIVYDSTNYWCHITRALLD